LAESEKEDFDARLGQVRVPKEAETDDELGQFRKAAELVCCSVSELTVTEYRRLAVERDDLASLSRLTKRLGSWKQAREAAQWSESQTLRKSRLAYRTEASKGRSGAIAARH
jgi:hypothetical protein